jgi:hypothetical protein
MEFKDFTPAFIKAKIRELNHTLPSNQKQVLNEGRMDDSRWFQFGSASANTDISRFADNEAVVDLIQAILYILPLWLKYGGQEKKNCLVTCSLKRRLEYFFEYTVSHVDLSLPPPPVCYPVFQDFCLAPFFATLLTDQVSTAFCYFRECVVLAMIINGMRYKFDKAHYQYFLFPASVVAKVKPENLYTFLKRHPQPVGLRSLSHVFKPTLIRKYEMQAAERRRMAYKCIRFAILSQPRYLPTDLWRLIAWVVIDHVNRQVM